MDSDENEWLRRDVMNENNIPAEKRFSLATMQLALCELYEGGGV